MTFVVTPDQMRAAEQSALDSGRTEDELICEAAAGIAEWIEDNILNYGQSRKVVGLIGPGKNGADALVALAYLVELGWEAVACAIEERDITTLPADQASLQQITLLDDLSTVVDVSVVLDGLYGLGGRPELPEGAASLSSEVAEIRRSRHVPVVAIDVPSGVDSLTGEASDSAITADVTLSIGFMKTGLLFEPTATLAGDVYVIDIHVTAPDDSTIVTTLTHEAVAGMLPPRKTTAGKHDHGGLLVIGGAPTYFGAPRLAAEAGLRVGTGLVGAAVPRMLISTVAAQLPEVVFVPLNDSDSRRSVSDLTDAIAGEHARYTAAVLGPGLGRDEPAKALLAGLFGQAATKTTAPIGFGAIPGNDSAPQPEQSALGSVPLVLDADALNWLSEQETWPRLLENVSAVLTPHPGEMARLRGVDVEEIKRDPRQAAREAAQQWNQVVVLKGGYTAVASPDGRVSVAHRATPELASPGTGDVLSGIIGGFLAQGLTPYDAACAAVYIGAEAGRFARNAHSSRSVIARDLIDNISAVLDVLDGARIWV